MFLNFKSMPKWDFFGIIVFAIDFNRFMVFLVLVVLVVVIDVNNMMPLLLFCVVMCFH